MSSSSLTANIALPPRDVLPLFHNHPLNTKVMKTINYQYQQVLEQVTALYNSEREAPISSTPWN